MSDKQETTEVVKDVLKKINTSEGDDLINDYIQEYAENIAENSKS